MIPGESVQSSPGHTFFEHLLDVIERASQLLAARLGRASEPGGDFGPLVALASEVGDPTFLVGEPAAEFFKKVAVSDDSTGTGDFCRPCIQEFGSTRFKPPVVAPIRAMTAIVGSIACGVSWRPTGAASGPADPDRTGRLRPARRSWP